MKTHGTTALAPILVALACLVAAAPLQAQTDPGPWVPLDPSPPGTAAEVVFDPILSSAVDSFFDVFIHGFYSPTRIGLDGLPYREVNVPGLRLDRPDRCAGTAGGGHHARHPHRRSGSGDQPVPAGSHRDAARIPALAPAHPASDSGSTAEIFVRDPTIYSGARAAVSAQPRRPGPVINLLPGITGAILKVHPAFWKPGTGELQIAAHIRLSLHHPGNVAVRPPAPRTRVWQAQSLCMNWQSTNQFFLIDEESLKGEYLFVRPISYGFAILPLWYQKEARGFRLFERVHRHRRQLVPRDQCRDQELVFFAPQQRTLCAPGRGPTRRSRCASRPRWDSLPWLPRPTISTARLTVTTSRRRSTVGRLSVSSVAECSQQIARIVAYEDSPPADQNFSNVVLISHRETSPRNFPNCQEAVRTARLCADAQLHDHLWHERREQQRLDHHCGEPGPGLVCYRGHGD